MHNDDLLHILHTALHHTFLWTNREDDVDCIDTCLPKETHFWLVLGVGKVVVSCTNMSASNDITQSYWRFWLKMRFLVKDVWFCYFPLTWNTHGISGADLTVWFSSRAVVDNEWIESSFAVLISSTLSVLITENTSEPWADSWWVTLRVNQTWRTDGSGTPPGSESECSIVN